MKRILSMAVALAMVASFSTIAFATETSETTYDGTNAANSDLVAATNPYGTEDPDIVTDGRASYGEATVNANASVTGTDEEGNNIYDYEFYYTDDDDSMSGVNDTTGGDITVWAQVQVDEAVVYKLDIEWGSMKFQYTNTASEWDPDSHSYITLASADDDGTVTAWTADYLDGENNKLTITNHSNAAVEAEVDFALTTLSDASGNSFNAFEDGTTDLNDAAVQGNFYTTSAAATAAALELGAVLPATLDADEYDAFVAKYDTGDSTPIADAYELVYYTSAHAVSDLDNYDTDGNGYTQYELKDDASGYIAVDLSDFDDTNIDSATGLTTSEENYPNAGTLYTTYSMALADAGNDAEAMGDYDTITLHNASGYYNILTDTEFSTALTSDEDATYQGSKVTWPAADDEAYNALLTTYGFASDLYFAFSGTPDNDADLTNMTSVGTITVTVSTYADVEFEYDASVDPEVDGVSDTVAAYTSYNNRNSTT